MFVSLSLLNYLISRFITRQLIEGFLQSVTVFYPFNDDAVEHENDEAFLLSN